MSRAVAAPRPFSANTLRAAASNLARFCAFSSSRRPLPSLVAMRVGTDVLLHAPFAGVKPQMVCASPKEKPGAGRYAWRVFRRILRTNSPSIRQHLLVRVALALAVASACVSIAGVLASRQAASQRLHDQAATARAVFDHSLALRERHARSADERARAVELAAADAGRVSGAEVTLGSPTPAGRIYTYRVRGGRELMVVVPTTPVAKATRSALFMGLGVGGGAVLVLVSLMLAGVERAATRPLARLADANR